MTTENPKHRRTAQEPEQHSDLSVQQSDLEPQNGQSDKVRGGVLPPDDKTSASLEPTNGIRGVYILPPEG